MTNQYNFATSIQP